MTTAFPTLLTAMATPLDADGAVDLDGAQALARHLADTGSGGIVVAGTTGESPTLSGDEVAELLTAVIEAVGDRAAVVAGTGSYDTAATVRATERATELGVDGVMVVTPYYNRPSQRGLVAHMTAAAGATDLPVMLYNIPGRTACEIEPATLLQLAEDVPGIRAVKDAVGDMAKASWLAARAPEGFQILSGDDKNCLPLLAVGGTGLVSVAAHLAGRQIADMIQTFPTDPAAARAIHLRLMPLFEALFVEPSPGPLKAALALLDLPGAGALRLPMVPVTDHTTTTLRDALATAGLLAHHEDTP